jgi:protein-disulfide isomerase
MRDKGLLVLLRLPLLVALTASAALWIEYQNAGDPAFCSAGSGCAKVRASEYSRLFGVPLPIIGLVAFGLLYALSLMAKTKLMHRVVAAVASLGGLAGVALIVLQATAVHAFCKWCVAVDSSSIVAGCLALFLLVAVERSETARERIGAALDDFPTTVAWTAAGALAVALPFIWARYPTVPPLPEDLVPMTVPGKVNIISFTDFQCPYCRKFHPKLDELREQHQDKIHFVRLMVPLPGHGAAMPAALAWECVPEAAQNAMAHELYLATPQVLKSGAADLAVNLGVDKEHFEACIADPATKAKVEADIALFKKIEGGGLPLTYVNEHVVIGNNPDRLQANEAIALEPKRPELPVWLMWVALALIYAGASALTLRRREASSGATAA